MFDKEEQATQIHSNVKDQIQKLKDRNITTKLENQLKELTIGDAPPVKSGLDSKKKIFPDGKGDGSKDKK